MTASKNKRIISLSLLVIGLLPWIFILGIYVQENRIRHMMKERLEEGLPLADLARIVRSMGDAAKAAGVPVVPGDTKVVERGKADGVFITTTGVGVLSGPLYLGVGAAQVVGAHVVDERHPPSLKSLQSLFLFPFSLLDTLQP